MVAHAFNPSTQEAETGGAHVLGHHEIQSKSLSQK